MTNVEKLLNFLDDGEWRTRDELYTILPKSSYRNAIFEARRRGFNIELRQYGVRDTRYRLNKDTPPPKKPLKNRLDTCLEVLKDKKWHPKKELDEILGGQAVTTIHRIRSERGLMVATSTEAGLPKYKLESEL